MHFPDLFPISLSAWLRGRYGLPQAIRPLKGLSHNMVWRVEFVAETVIVKNSQQAAEAEFYTHAAPQLQQQGVSLPAVYWLQQEAGFWWFVIEYIPQPLPPERVATDPAVVRNLAYLHRAQLTSRPTQLFRPQWTDEMTTAALSFYTSAEQAVLRPLLERWQQVFQPLTAAVCYISGDPNPRNWGVRDNGDVVLYDWERFGRGTPAVDLAISVAGLGTPEIFAQLADSYRALAIAEKAPELAPTAASIIVAKCWNVVEFLSMVHSGLVADSSFLPRITAAFYQWLQTMKESGVTMA